MYPAGADSINLPCLWRLCHPPFWPTGPDRPANCGKSAETVACLPRSVFLMGSSSRVCQAPTNQPSSPTVRPTIQPSIQPSMAPTTSPALILWYPFNDTAGTPALVQDYSGNG